MESLRYSETTERLKPNRVTALESLKEESLLSFNAFIFNPKSKFLSNKHTESFLGTPIIKTTYQCFTSGFLCLATLEKTDCSLMCDSFNFINYQLYIEITALLQNNIKSPGVCRKKTIYENSITFT